MIEIRASSLGRILQCPASLQVHDGLDIRADDYFARLGTAGHVLATHVVRGLRDLYAETLAVAHEHQVEHEELSMLGNLVRQCWESLAEHFPDPRCEEQFSYTDHDAGVTLTGKPDVFDVVDHQVRVADFKTGYNIEDHDTQLIAYGFLAAKRYPFAESFWGAPVHVRHRQLGEPIEMTRGELLEWWDRVCEKVKRDYYKPSHENCQYCPRQTGCEARQELLRDAVGVLSGIDTPMTLANVPDDQLRMGVIAARHLAKLCETYLDLAKTEVLIRGSHREDVHTIGINGMIVRKEHRREITKDAWPILLNVIGEDAMRDCCRISKTAVEKAIGATAERGGKSKAIAATMKALDDAGAVVVNAVEKLIVEPMRAIEG